MYWLLIQVSLLLSKNAGDLLKRFSSKILTNSSLVKISCSPSGDHPSNVMKLNNASGRYPNSSYCSMNWMIVSSRLDNFFLFSFTIRVMWPNLGGSNPNASYTTSCFGVFDTWSSPRRTWEICIKWSSIATAKLYVATPSFLMITKSPKSCPSNDNSPLTISSNLYVLSCGTRIRIDGFLPSFSNASCSSLVRWACFPL